jgi:hypothetical protein
MVSIIEPVENMDNNYKFKPGDFVTFSNKSDSFAIYEGVDLSVSSYKKLSVLLYYDPNKYTQTEEGYVMRPFLEYSNKGQVCEKTLDTDEPSYWTRRCNTEEYKEAMEVLHNHGLIWDEENLAVLNAETGEVVTKICAPKLEYKGQIIKPMSSKFKKLLKFFCLSKNPKTTYNYSNYWDRYGEGCYDEYWD